MSFFLFRKIALTLVPGCLTLATLLLAQQPHKTPGPSANPLNGQPPAIEAGQTQFRQICSNCHGTNGEGGQGEGQGPSLVTNSDVRNASDAALFAIIHNGIAGTAMPAFAFPDQQIWQLVAFVRSLNDTAISLHVPGSVKAGRQIFSGKGECASCHMIRGRGGFLGPDLTDIGASRRLGELRDAILKTGGMGSTSGDLYGDPLAGYRPVILKTEDGRTLEGVAKHYSNYSMQVLDKDGKLHLLHGAAMKAVSFKDKSWMPDDYAKRLTSEEIQDLLAFLSRQSVRLLKESKSTAAPQPEEED